MSNEQPTVDEIELWAAQGIPPERMTAAEFRRRCADMALAHLADREDARRYRWLRDELWETFKIPESVKAAMLKPQNGKHEDIDAAIDAARKSSDGRKG